MIKRYLVITIVIISLMGLVGCADAVQTGYDEFKVSTLLKKYEYFKDLSASIDKKRADIDLYRSELKDMDQDKDRDEYNSRRRELLGIISVHNKLCAEYNSLMSKGNYAFTNKGSLPKSNLEPLPREIKPYILNLKGDK